MLVIWVLLSRRGNCYYMQRRLTMENILSTDAVEFSINCFDVRVSERNINFGRLLQLFTGYYRKGKFIFTFGKMPQAALPKTSIHRVDLRRYTVKSVRGLDLDYFDIRATKSNRRSRSRSGVASWINELQVSSIVQHISVRNIVCDEDNRKNATISRIWIFAKYSQ